MVKLYADLIDGGLWTITKVPAIWRDDVQEEIYKRHPELRPTVDEDASADEAAE